MANINSGIILKCLGEFQKLVTSFEPFKTFKPNLVYFTGPDDKEHVEIQCWNLGKKIVSYYPKDTDLRSEKDFTKFLMSKLYLRLNQK